MKENALARLKKEVSFWSTGILICLWVLPALACGNPFNTKGTPTPLPSPTPLGDTLSLTVPVYNISIGEGGQVPSTALYYVRPSESGYEVIIDGVHTIKYGGDSFSWRGVLVPGVIGSFNLRLTTTFFGNLVAAGPVTLNILNPEPLYLNEIRSHILPTDLHYQNITMQYNVPVGFAIPGTGLMFMGMVEPDSNNSVSQRMAQFAGSAGHSLYAVGDAIVWQGQLRSNVFVSYSMRIISIDANNLNVLGTGEIWVR